MDNEKTEGSYRILDSIYAFLTILLGYCFIRFVLWNVTGFFTTFFYIAMIIACLLYLNKSDYKLKRYHILQLILLVVFSFVFSITSNSVIKFLDFFFVTILGIYWVYSVCSENHTVERYFLFVMLKSVVVLPFSSLAQLPKVIVTTTKKSKISRNIGLALLGLMVTIPLTIVVALLLTSADQGFEAMLTNFFENVFLKGAKFIFQMLLAVPVAFYLFGMLYSNNQKDKNPYNEEQCERNLKKFQVTPNIAVYAAVTPICVLYILFVISQIQYFISAFCGNLPGNYSYAQYARRGFFELCVIAMINLIVIFFMNLIAKHRGKEKPVFLKLYTSVISLFTLFIISTAISKMGMYIGQYGFTQLRIYTSWFMILMAFAFILIILKQCKKEFHFVKYMSLTFVILFGILCFANIDRNIAKYNIKMFQAGCIHRLDLVSICETDEGLLYLKQHGMDTGNFNIEYRTLDQYERNPYKTYNLTSLRLKWLLEKENQRD